MGEAPRDEAACRAEVAALTALAHAMLDHAPYAAAEIKPWLRHAADGRDPHGVEDLFRDLRRRWLRAAHDAANAHQRSPRAEETTRLPSGAPLEFGYERELDPAQLERRAAAFLPAPNDYDARHLVFSSGQSALLALLLTAGGEARHRPLRVAHVGSYFETGELLKLFGAEIVTAGDGEPAIGRCDLAILEPVYLKERFACLDPVRLRSALAQSGCPPLIAVDTTLSHRCFSIDRLTELVPHGCTVVRISSLLKLDQAGFELANAGLLSIYASRADGRLDGLATRLETARGITGTSLDFAGACALDVPWLFDGAASDAYAAAVFANNARLAGALAGGSGWAVTHPAFDCPQQKWAVAPYVVVRLRDPSRSFDVAAAIERETERGGLAFWRGGSFGFRTHRFDVVEPAGEEPFLRFAMGASDVSRDEAIALVATMLSTV